MSWIDIAWPMMASTCLTLAFIHFLVWTRERQRIDDLLFALSALPVSAVALLEVAMMHADSPGQYATLLRWLHIPLATMVVAMLMIVRVDLQVGRPWLAWLGGGLRVAVLAANFLSGANLNFIEVTALRPFELWGGARMLAPIGVANPWMLVAQASNLLVFVFLADAAISARRKGDWPTRRRAVVVCSSMAACILLGGTWNVLAMRGVVPTMLTPFFAGVMLVMSYELGGEILRSAQLARNLLVAQENLRKSEQHVELAVIAAAVGLWDWDMARGKVWLSEQGLRLLGFAPTEAFDSGRLLARVHADDRDQIKATLAQTLQGRDDAWCEFRLLSPGGGARWIVARGRTEFGEDGKATRMSGVVVDITERKQSDLLFQLAVESAPTATLMVDGDGRIVLVNQQAERVFGYPHNVLIGMNVDQLVPASIRDSHAGFRAGYGGDATARAMGAGRELFGQRQDGSLVPVEIALTPIRSDQGLFVLASVVDISERKRMERESALQREELAHLSRVALLSELSGSLAHELNQPLTAILSNAQAAVRFMAHSPPNLAEVGESLTNIIENDKRAGEVIRRLRAMLRKDSTDYRQLDVNEVVMDVLRIIRSDLLNRNIELVLELATNLPPVGGDRVQLQQVLLNLVMNGSDAMSELAQSRQLTIRTQATFAGVEVSVADNGTGIPTEDLERIFSPFVTSKKDGMGLGLAVCTTIVQTHGGKLWATNNLQRGATVHFSLPVPEPA